MDDEQSRLLYCAKSHTSSTDVVSLGKSDLGTEHHVYLTDVVVELQPLQD